MRWLTAAVVVAAAYVVGFSRGYWFRHAAALPPIDDIDWTRGDARLLTFPYHGTVN